MAFQKIMLGETNSLTKNFTDLTFNEKAVLVPIAIIVIITGIYPKPIFDLISPSIDHILSFINN